MTKLTKTIKELTGEDATDMFGGDAENIAEELNEPIIEEKKSVKYRAKFVTKMWCYKDIDIMDESDPYKEARIIADTLKQEDFTFDDADVEIDKLKPTK